MTYLTEMDNFFCKEKHLDKKDSMSFHTSIYHLMYSTEVLYTVFILALQ